jgi:hypothetical protein
VVVDEKTTLAQAFLSAQKSFTPIEKDKDNPYYHSRYASLDQIIKATRPSLHKHGIVDYHEVSLVDGVLTVTSVIELVGTGERRSNAMSIAVGVAPSMQPLGSQITYLRRYTLSPLLGACADEDDDGNASTEKPVMVPQPQKRPTMSEADRKYVEEATLEIFRADEDQLNALAEIFRGKSEAVREALKVPYGSRLRVLRSPTE